MSDGVVELDVDKFRKAYPLFSSLSNEQIENVFFEATIILNNTKQSPIKNLQRREFFLFLAMAHICALTRKQDQGNDAVGRIASASEGTVSVSLDYGASSNSSKWWDQTTYGAKYWQYTKQYRVALIVSLHEQMYVKRANQNSWR